MLYPNRSEILKISSSIYLRIVEIRVLSAWKIRVIVCRRTIVSFIIIVVDPETEDGLAVFGLGDILLLCDAVFAIVVRDEPRTAEDGVNQFVFRARDRVLD